MELGGNLPWLLDRLAEHGVVPTVGRVASVTEVHRPGVDVVVDCAGIGAARLASDDTLVPVRGQVVLVDAPGVTDVWLDPDGPGGATYVIPRSDAVVCGGTAEHGVWDRTPDDAVAAEIVARAAALVRSPTRRCSTSRSACGRRGPRCGWSSRPPRRGRSCTTTATAVPA